MCVRLCYFPPPKHGCMSVLDVVYVCVCLEVSVHVGCGLA
jgi:hypothetical protein